MPASTRPKAGTVVRQWPAWVELLVAGVAYVAFVRSMMWLIAFLAGVGSRTVDAGGPAAPVGTAVAVDLSLILAFTLPHSLMARQGYKRWLLGWLPSTLERSVYVLVASALLVGLLLAWRPLPQVVWRVEQPTARLLCWLLCGLGWALALAASWELGHHRLFGIEGPWRRWRGRPSSGEAAGLQVTKLHGVVRHPMYLGFLVAIWATPQMSAGHLLFSLAMSAYVFVGLGLEERDLARRWGVSYQRYRRRTPALIPGLRVDAREEDAREK